MANTLVEDKYIAGVERLSAYRHGGYHPIHMNGCLHDRYRIVHKLGHGTFSTVWLARDFIGSRYVAIKVSTADAENTEADALLHIQRGISACSRDKEKASLICIILDQFTIKGPNGTHPCFVTTPARCSLRDAKEDLGSGLLQLDVARSLAAQLVIAVSLVHSQGYAHGGTCFPGCYLHDGPRSSNHRLSVSDLHLGNILLKLPSSMNNISVEQLYKMFGAPELEPVVRVDGKSNTLGSGVPSHVVPPMWLGETSEKITLSEASLLLTDFGVAFRPSDKSRFESFTPLVLRPPEALFEPTTPLSFESDIWSLGCVIFELLAHRSLIDGFLAPQDEIIAQQIHLQGPPPPEWWSKYENRDEWFDKAWKPLCKDGDIWPWNRRFEQWIQEPRQRKRMEAIGAEEKAALMELLQSMLAWRPKERPSAEQVLISAWMRKWALPAYEKARA